eukprot:g4505.t1
MYEGVKTLHIAGAKNVTNYGLAQLGRGCQSLTSLDISHCSKVSDVGVRAMAIGCTQLVCVGLAGLPLVKNVGIVALGQYCLDVAELSLRGNRQLESWLLARVAEFAHMKKLDLSMMPRVSDETLKAIGNHCHGLKWLDLTGDPAISDVGILELTKGCPELEVIRMPRKSLQFKFTDVSLLTLSDRAMGIIELDIAGCNFITDVGMDWLAAGCHGLQKLNMEGLFKISDAGLRCLGDGCGELRDLNIRGLKLVTDVGLRYLTHGCKKLEKLVLADVFKLTDGMARDFGLEGLQAMAQECHALTSLNLSNCFQVSSRVLRAIGKGCPSITSLRLAGCQAVDTSALAEIVRRTKGLKSLSLAGCMEIDSNALRIVGESCSGLTTVNLSGCRSLSDTAIQSLAKCCKSLRSANFSDCNLTDYSLLAISEAEFMPGLESLNISSSECTDTGISWLAERCTSLTMLEMTRCSQITHSAIKSMRESWKHVEFISNEKFFGLRPVDRGADKRHIDEYGHVWETATKIQAIYRARRDRRLAAIKREQYLRNWVASKLQAMWRSRKARRYMIIKQMARRREDEAARLMQNQWRKRQARKELARRQERASQQQLLEAALLVQRLYRGKRTRKMAQAALAARREYERRVQASASKLQAAWRARGARQQVAMMRAAKLLQQREEEMAASKLQQIYRGRLARRQMLLRKKMKEEHGEMETQSAILIQTRFRGLRARRARHRKISEGREREKAAIRIQSIYRARKGRMAAHIKKRAMQAHIEHEAALKLQGAWRKKQANNIMNTMRKAREFKAQMREKAAITCQSAFRGHKARKRVRVMRQNKSLLEQKQQNLEEWAAVIVQKAFRGKLGRRQFEARQIEVARRWKEMWDAEQERPFYYNMNTGEIRWRKPQELLELDPRPPCNNCGLDEAHVECGDCSEFFCQECWDAVHFGGKRKKHKFRCLYDYYGRRIDYGDGGFPSVWPSEIEQDDLYGWHIRGDDPRQAAARRDAADNSLALPVEHVQKWTKYWDETSNAYFYFNSETEESTYERPATYRSVASARGGHGAQNLGPNGGWEKHNDPESGADFYYNSHTGESTFDRPGSFTATPGPTPRPGQTPLLSDRASGWEKHWSDDWNQNYYYNRHTGVSVFERPQGFATPGPTPRPGAEPISARVAGNDWIKYWDDDTEQEFYYNEATQESTFERPHDYVSPAPSPRPATRGEAGGQLVVVPTLDLSTATSSWQKYYDDSSSQYYYHDSITGESTFERPAGFQTPH